MRYRQVLIAVAAATSLSACGAQSSSNSVTVPAVTTPSGSLTLAEPTCQARNIGALYGLTLEGPDVPEPMAVPSGFSPTSVVTCEPDWAGGTAEGTAAWVESHREGSLETVLRAYGEVSEPRDPSCHADQVIPPTVWLVDEQGKGMRPALPQTECGAYKLDAITAIEQLPVTESIVQQATMTP